MMPPLQKPASARRHARGEHGQWSAADVKYLEQRLAASPLGKKEIWKPLEWLNSPDAGLLLCSAKEDVFERTTGYLANLNIMSGLVLSSIISTALDPIDLDDLPPGKRHNGYIYNVLGFVAVVVQISLVLYSTLVLAMMQSLGSNPATTYRFLLYGGRILSLFMFLCFVPNVLVIGIVMIKFNLNLPDDYASHICRCRAILQ